MTFSLRYLVVLAALFAVAHAITYNSTLGRYQGDSIRFWNFGVSDRFNSSMGSVYSTAMAHVQDQTLVKSYLLCGTLRCPPIVRENARTILSGP